MIRHVFISNHCNVRSRVAGFESTTVKSWSTLDHSFHFSLIERKNKSFLQNCWVKSPCKGKKSSTGKKGKWTFAILNSPLGNSCSTKKERLTFCFKWGREKRLKSHLTHQHVLKNTKKNRKIPQFSKNYFQSVLFSSWFSQFLRVVNNVSDVSHGAGLKLCNETKEPTTIRPDDISKLHLKHFNR